MTRASRNHKTQFWSVLTRRYPSEHDPLDVERAPKSTLVSHYRRLKAAVARWLRIRPAIDVADSAWPDLKRHN
jgi:hypothetical protein